MGMIFAHDAKQYGKWRREADRKAPLPAKLDDAALEAAILRVGEMFPGRVEYV